jgi:ABC-type uncharacterized transport system substrate-binding protein
VPLNRRELLFAVGALIAAPAWASPRRYALLYPDVPEPEREVFRVVRESLSNALRRTGGAFSEQALAARATPDAVAAAIADAHADVVITLGHAPTALAREIRPTIPWLTGVTEMPVPTPGVGGISLVVNPDRFVSALAEVAPRINRIAVVLSPAHFGWMRGALERAAHAQSKTLTVFQADTIGEAATRYLNIVRYGNPKTDSLWLLEQGEFLSQDTLPHIIEEAWANEFLVFSSVLNHVNEGSLFALYLNPAALGERLARLALSTQSHAVPIAFDDAPARAINLRTARHLSGIVEVGATKSFDLIVGER